VLARAVVASTTRPALRAVWRALISLGFPTHGSAPAASRVCASRQCQAIRPHPHFGESPTQGGAHGADQEEPSTKGLI
jgi:hypothetical protein